MNSTPNKLYITQKDIASMLDTIVSKMKLDNYEPEAIVGLNRGGLQIAVMLSHYFDVYPNYYPLRRFLYKVQLNFSLFNRLIILIVKIKRIISIAFSRIKLFLTSKIYRKRLLNNPQILKQKISDFLK